MDLDSLRCFDAVATTLNFRAAAARVHLSPAAFSDRVKRLEEALGKPLLVRTTRKATLSEHGWALLPLVREVLAGVERLKLATPERAPLPYELTIGTRYELGLSWLCPALTPLSRAHPERTIHLYNGDTPDLRSRLQRGDLDAVVGSMRLTGVGLTYAALHEEAYVLVGSKHTRLRGSGSVRSLVLVDVTPDLPLFHYFLDATPGGESWSFERVECVGGIAAIRRRLLDSKGRVAVLPAYFLRDDLRSHRLVRLMPRVKMRSDSFRLIWRAGHPREPELQSLARELQQIPLR